jgi:hypothetical protein
MNTGCRKEIEAVYEYRDGGRKQSQLMNTGIDNGNKGS